MIYKISCAVFIRQDTVENWEKFNPILRVRRLKREKRKQKWRKKNDLAKRNIFR